MAAVPCPAGVYCECLQAAKKPHINAGQAVDFVALRDWFMPRFAAWQANASAVITTADVVAAYTPDTLWVPNPNAGRTALPKDEGEEIVVDTARMTMLHAVKKAVSALRRPSRAAARTRMDIPIGAGRVRSGQGMR